MRVAVLGTGMVGRAMGTKLVGLGHEVSMGSRTAGNEDATAWADAAGKGAQHGTYADAASFGELVINCTAGAGSLEALRSAGAEHLAGKVLIDLANPLDHSKGFPPSLFTASTDSLGEQIQRAFPDAKVVKTLNTLSHEVALAPARVPGEHVVFLSGNDDGAKDTVGSLLESFGWPRARILDLGDITTSRGVEAYLLLWTRLLGVTGDGSFNIVIAR